MEKILYVLAIRSFMYDMICIKSNIKHTVGVVSIYIVNLRMIHSEVIKWLLQYLKGTSS